MAGIFDALRKYAGNWNVTARQNFTDNEINSVSRTEVVPSEYGLSVCFFFKTGGQSYLPVSRDSIEVEIGQSVDLKKCEVLTLSREGDSDIQKIEIKGN